MKYKLLTIALLCLALGSASVHAATNYWDINGATPGAGGPTPGGAWTGSNWSPDSTGSSATTTFTSGDVAIFSAGSDATGTFTVTGNATAGGINVEEGKVIIAGTITLGANDISIASGATISANSSARISASAGSVITINGGTWESTNPGAAGSFVDVDQTIVLNGGGTISHTVAGVLNIVQTDTVISGTGPLVKDGAGTIAIASACTYSGSTIISNGIVRIRTSSNRLPTGTDLFVYSPGVFDPGSTGGSQVQQVNSINGDGNITYSASSTLTIAGSGSSSLSGVISDGSAFGKIIKQGTGSLTLSGINTYDGTFTLSAGTCTVDPGATLIGSVGDVVVNGGTLNLNNPAQSIENLTGTGGTINLASGHTLTIGPVANGTFSGSIAGAGSLIKANTTANSFSLTLSGANSYSGSTAVNAGKLVTTTASTGAGSYSVADGTTLGAKVASVGTTLNVSDLTLGASTLEFDFAGLGIPTAKVLNDAGTIAVNGTVPVDVKGFETTGTATLLEYAGARSGAGSFTLGVLPPRTFATLTDDTANSKVTLDITTGSDSLRWVGDATGNWDINNAANQIWQLVTGGTPTEYQETAVQGDIVRFDDTATGVTTVNHTATLIPYRVTVDNTTKDYTFNGTGKLSGPGTLIKSGSGQLTIQTTNDFTGGATLNAGAVNVGTATVFGSGKLTINGGALRSDSGTARTLTMPVDLNADVALGDAVNTGDLTFSTGPWTLAGGSRQITVDTVNATISSVIGQDASGRALTKAGAGTLSLTAANAFTGGFNHNAGTVRVNSTTALGAANSPVTYADGVTLSTTAGTGRTLTYSHKLDGNITLGQTTGGTAAVTLAGTVDLGGATRTITVVNATDTLSGVVTNGGLTKEGTGILVLTNPGNTNSGTTTINAGTLSIDADATIGDGTGTLVFNGGRLNVTADRSVTTAPVGNPLNLMADAEITTSSTATTVNLNLTSSSITAGTVTLTFRNDGANAATDVFEPRFSAGGLNFSRPIVIDNGAVGQTRLSFFNTNTTTQTFSGVISGNGGIRRSASVSGTGGTTIFTEENTYSGATTINDGTLLVNNTTGSGTGSGTVTVTSGGTLGGTGTVGGAVVVSGGGSVAPGASAGTLTLGGGLDLSAGGTYRWELGAYSTTPGDFDQIALTGGDLVLGGTSKLSVNFTGSAASPDGGNVFWASPHSWTVVNLAGGGNPGDSDVLSVLNGVYANGYFTTSVSSGNLVLNFTPGAPPLPEFSSLAGAGTTSVTINLGGLIKGATYLVQYKDDLNDTDWSILGSVTAAGSTASIIDTTSPAPAQRFFRIVEQ